MIGLGEALIIGGVVVLIFGATQIPKLAKSMGLGLKEFKKAVKDAKGDETAEEQDQSSVEAENGDQPEGNGKKS